MKFAKIYLGLLVLIVFVAAYTHTNRVNAENDNQKSTACEKRVTLLNNRSQLLSRYKETQEKQFQRERKKWVTRIGYASQWTEGDAKKARDSLYKYDDLHKKLTSELDSQINSYKYLETQPLDCSDANKPAVKGKLVEVRGIKGKKAVSGQALIAKLKKEESDYAKGDFKKDTSRMVDSLHKEKQSHRTPKQKPFEIK